MKPSLGDEPAGALTDKEKEVLRAYFRLRNTKLVARELGLSVPGVDYRLKSARQGLGVSGSMEAAAILAEREGSLVYGNAVVPLSTVAADAVVEASSPPSWFTPPWRTSNRPEHDRRFVSTVIGTTTAFAILVLLTYLLLSVVSLLTRSG